MTTPRDYLDRQTQLLYPLELHCNRYKTKTKRYESDKKKIDVEAKKNRPKRTAAAISSANIKDRAKHDDSDND